MKKNTSNKPDERSSKALIHYYDRQYFLTCNRGYELYEQSQGMVLPYILRYLLELADIKPGERVLDIGCGRGEIMLHACQRYAQIFGGDLSPAALELSKKLLVQHTFFADSAQLIRFSADALPFKSESFDTIFMLDIIEHLSPQEAEDTIKDALRVLKNDGKIILHTAPNLHFKHTIYRVFRIFSPIMPEEVKKVLFTQEYVLKHGKLPTDMRQLNAYAEIMHINEFSYHSLRNLLEDQDGRFIICPIFQLRSEKPVFRMISFILSNLWLVNRYICYELVAIVRK